MSLTSATEGGRMRISEMVDGTTLPSRALYESGYRDAIKQSCFRRSANQPKENLKASQ